MQADNTRMIDILLRHGFMTTDLGDPTTLRMRLRFRGTEGEKRREGSMTLLFSSF